MTAPNSTAPEVQYTRDLAGALDAALAALGARRVLILGHPSRRFVERVVAGVGDRPCAIFAEARTHVPQEVVERASEALSRAQADTIVSVGGGSAVGLGKALRLEHALRFVAVPTTYAGSEQTNLYGIRRGGEKQTGRDERVRPDVVLYAAELLADLPAKLQTQSLLNALAHPISALSAESLAPAARAEALDTAGRLARALEELARAPERLAAKEEALRAAARAAAILDAGVLGVHHRLAHRLGGRFDLGHAALHSVLLPYTLRALADETPALYAEIERAVGVPDVPAVLYDLLVRTGAPTSLRALEVDTAKVDEFLATDSDLPGHVVRRALVGGRPSTRVRYEDWGLDHPVRLAGPSLARARLAVIALHGRGSSAGDFLKRIFEITGDAGDVAIIAPQAAHNRWYPKPYGVSLREHGADLDRALAAVDAVVRRALESISPERLWLAGFSQGACLAAEYAARRDPPLGGLIALSGARIGALDEQPALSADLGGMPVLLGASEQDPFIRSGDVAHTAAAFRAAGAAVEVRMTPGEGHELATLHRLRARELLLERSARETLGGFGNTHESEALPGALPRIQNTPRRAPYGLYPEQVNATGFTASRGQNRRSWLYRIRPAAQHSALVPLDHPRFAADFQDAPPEPNLVGWRPVPLPEEPTDFVDGLATLGGAGSPSLRRGFAVHAYAANRSMENRAFYDADGELLLVPELGRLTLLTELGVLEVGPGQIAILPRGLKFAVMLDDGAARGWLGEVYGRAFRLPERGPIGANGLADARHFHAPSAYHEDRLSPGYRITTSYLGRLFEARQDHSPFDVVAWHGDLAPYVYDLAAFSPVGNARIDHIDPSVHTVVSAPLDEQGAHTLDFVFFPARWDVTEGTFRPPFFHRNAVTELNGIVREPGGAADSAFQAGGTFLTPSMTPHGVRAHLVERVLAMSDEEADAPMRLGGDSLWFQFETMLPMSLSRWAREGEHRIADWHLTPGAYRAHYRPPGLDEGA
jgi:homogentisate 1,2-dioxygenase